MGGPDVVDSGTGSTGPGTVSGSDTFSRNEELLARTFHESLNVNDEVGCVPTLLTNLFYQRRQEDAHEFLQGVLNVESAPALHALCYGRDSPQLICRGCGFRRAVAAEGFTWLCLSLKDADGGYLATVGEALAEYMRPVAVDADYVWRCGRPGGCRNSEPPLKQHQIDLLPRVLCLQLVRWTSSAAGGALLHQVVPDPEVSLNGGRYLLQSVVCHLGNTSHSGHYTSLVRFPTRDGLWWYYNNRNRRAARDADLRTTDVERAYLVFYEKVEAD